MDWTKTDEQVITEALLTLETILQRQGQLLSEEQLFGEDESQKSEDWQASMNEYTTTQKTIDDICEGRPLPASLQPILQRLQALQQSNETLLQGKLAHLRQDLRKVQTGRQGRQAYYGRGPTTGGAFVDQKK